MSALDQVQKPAPVKKVKAAPKEKKVKTTKTASHPPYFEMIKEALLALNEKSGSSPYAIAKHMEEKHKAVLPANFRKILGLQIKNSASKGKLIKIKASYKLSESGKKEKTVTAKPAAKKPAAAAVRKSRVAKAGAADPAAGTKRKVETVKKVAAAKKVVKKATPTKKVVKKATPTKKVVKKATPTKAKQPKSIKSPAAKRAKRVAGA